MPKTPIYDNESITSLKGADRVRKRPAVIFCSDGIEGCEHSVFEILSNSVDEAREGYGNVIHITVTKDGVISIEDEGRGVPLDFNEKEGKYNQRQVNAKQNKRLRNFVIRYDIHQNRNTACPANGELVRRNQRISRKRD